MQIHIFFLFSFNFLPWFIFFHGVKERRPSMFCPPPWLKSGGRNPWPQSSYAPATDKINTFASLGAPYLWKSTCPQNLMFNLLPTRPPIEYVYANNWNIYKFEIFFCDLNFSCIFCQFPVDYTFFFRLFFLVPLFGFWQPGAPWALVPKACA